MWRLRKADEGHQAKQERRRGDNGHHQEELHDFVVIEPAVEAAVHVHSIVISLWRFPYPSAVEFFTRVKLTAHRYFGSAVSAAAISSAIRNALCATSVRNSCSTTTLTAQRQVTAGNAR